MSEYDNLDVLRIVFTIGLFLMLPFCLNEFSRIEWNNFDSIAIANLFLVVFCGTFLAYIFNLYGLSMLGATVAGSYIYIQPVLASLIAILFMGETIQPYKLVSAIMILAGVYLVNRQKRG